MPESWRSEMARMRNRWIITLTVVLSLLLHVGVALLFWKSNVGALKPPEESSPIFVDMVQSAPFEKTPEGIVTDRNLPANEKRPDKASALGYKDNRVEKETHRKDIPINKFSDNVGPKGRGGASSVKGGGDRGQGTGRDDRTGTGGPAGARSKPAPSTNDLIKSVSYADLAKENAGDAKGGGGNLSPYNPDVGDPGDAVNINTKSFKYMSYFSSIKEKIEWAWVYPQESQRMGQQGILTLTFTILRDGRLKDVKLIKSSGYSLLDHAAMQAVRDGSDYPPMPSGWEEQELTILANFQYRLIGTKWVY